MIAVVCRTVGVLGLILEVFAVGCLVLLSACELPGDFSAFHVARGAVVDAGQADAGTPDASVVDAGQADAGTALPRCVDGFGIYVGACHCGPTTCPCAAACVQSGTEVCCTPGLVPVCACTP